VILYLDTSSLLKLFINEPGSDDVAKWVAETEVLVTSRVAYAEARAALARAHRTARLSVRSYRSVLRSFEDAWGSLALVEASEPLVRLAGDLAERHALRGFDAIHLASAILLQRETGQPVGFSAWDERLMAAAGVEGMTRHG